MLVTLHESRDTRHGHDIGEPTIDITIHIPRWLIWPFVQLLLLYRLLRFGYPFRRIPLTQGKFAIVDPDDYYYLCKYKWYAIRDGMNFYAVRSITVKNGGKRRLQMHRCILNVPDGMFVDHINRNGLDNRKANLRPANRAQNAWNTAKSANRSSASKYKGVTWRRDTNLWKAQINVNRRQISLGSFHDELKAARAYDHAAKIYHRDFALLNFDK